MMLQRAHRSRFITLAPALLGAAWLASCERPQTQTPVQDTTLQRQGNRVTVPAQSPLQGRLDVERVQRSTVQHEVTAPASVEADPARQARILPPLAGRIVELKVRPGDAVRKGQELLVLDAPDFVAAQADYTRAKTVLAQAERTVARQDDLAAHGVIGQKDVDQARTERASAESDFNRAKDRLKSFGMDPDTVSSGSPLIVRSPMSGKVLDVATAPGEFRNDPNVPLMTVADLSVVWVTANVQEKDIRLVHRGDVAAAVFAAYPDEKFNGHVLFVADVLDPDTRTAKVRISFDNDDGRLKPAMFATVTLRTWTTKDLTVPTSALVMAGDRTTLFVEIDPRTFEQVPVQVGEQQESRTIIVNGVREGARVLVRNGALLQ
jgi:cobalt-zinc-cadmium efflux system membrane fusion protein